MQAIGNKIVVMPIKEEVKTSAIAVVEIRKDSLLKGKVLSGNNDEIQQGDIILFSSYGYEEWGDVIIITDDMVYARLSTSEIN